MTTKETISFKGEKNLWDRWTLKLKKEKVQIWDKLREFIKKDMERKK